MATKARHSEQIQFHDETVFTLRPLSIKNFRIFMEKLEAVQDETAEMAKKLEDGEADNQDGLGMLEHFLELSLFCVNSFIKEEDKYSPEDFEELVDQLLLQDILRICGGIEVGEPVATTTQSPLGRR